MMDEAVPGGYVKALILSRRKALKLNQSELAKQAEVSRSSIIAAEAGTSVPSIDLCLRLARALGIPLADLVRAQAEDSVRLANPEALKEIRGQLGGGRSHWEEIADHHGLRIERGRVHGVVNEEGDLSLTRRYEGCVATRPRHRLVFRDRVVGERAPLFAIKGSPKGLEYSMHVSIEGEWAQHRVEFRRPWTPADGAIDIEFETVLPRAYVLDLEDYNRRRMAEGLPPDRDWRGEFCGFVLYAIETLVISIVFPKSYVPQWRDPTATWSAAPPGDADYDEVHPRTCQSVVFKPGRDRGKLELTRPAPGYLFGLRWKPGAFEPTA